MDSAAIAATESRDAVTRSGQLSVAGGETAIAELTSRVEQVETRLAAYRQAFLASPVAMIVYAADSLQILHANESALSLYGYAPEALRKLTFVDLFAPQSGWRKSDLFAELQKPDNCIGPLNHQGVTNQKLIVSVVVSPFRHDDTDSRLAMVRDETERHATEEALRASEERYRELFENANDFIFLHALNGKILAVNRAAECLTGYSRTEVLGTNFSNLIAPDARKQMMDNIRAHLGGSASQHNELPILTKQGNVRFLEVSTRVVYRQGHPVAIQGIGRDITDRKQAERQAREAALELQLKNHELSTALRLAREATQLKEQFLANTSHELRTPMNGIMGMINLLRSTDLSPDQQEYADAVSQCANDLLTIINDLLDLSQIEAGRLSLADEPFDCHESLRAVTKLLRIRAEAKGLTMSYEISPELSPFIYGDSVRFRQVLTNLVANAIKFTSVGGIRVWLGPIKGSALRCEVVDSGIGVHDSVRERIFEAFCQADGTTRRRFGGTGLGLTISKQLVEIMGGRIGTHNNNPYPGSTFWFELPLRPAQPVAPDLPLQTHCPEVC